MLNFYRDERGFLRANTSEELELAASYFINEVQSCKYSSRRLKRICQEVLDGRLNYDGGTGNVYSLTFISANEVKIFNEYTEKSLTLTAAQFMSYLEEWRTFKGMSIDKKANKHKKNCRTQ